MVTAVQAATVRFLRCQPDPDPAAIHTSVEAGEEIPYGDPSVTDAQRAAAGRETLAEPSRALLEANRRAAGTLPDDQQLVRPVVGTAAPGRLEWLLT